MIIGKVVDTTGHPLRSISVYLNNTSMGTTTNEKGEFLLDHIPPAKYRLIVSGVAFKTISNMIDTRVSIPFMTITLSTQMDVLKGAVVTANDPDGWVHWGKLFTDLFVGTSPAATDCHILNPEVIRFRNNDDNTLTVYADKPIRLYNAGLGYDIRCTLEDFTYDFSGEVLAYSGEILFKDLALTHYRKAASWRKAREGAYRGSFLHFKRAFFANTLDTQGFRLNRLIRIVNAQKQRANLLFSKRPQLIDTVKTDTVYVGTNRTFFYHVADSTGFYKKALAGPDSLIDHQPIAADSVGYMEDSTTAGLYFRDSLEVIYLLKANPTAYKRVSQGWNQQHPVSRITLLNNRPVYLLGNGFHYQPEDIKITGYWAWANTMGTDLPFDYTSGPDHPPGGQ
jgi:CarboxypepD_reg-like domain